MTRIEDQVLRGCGIDIDARLLWATRFYMGRRKRVTWETESFANSPNGIVKLVEWLDEKKITHVAFESTGIYWELLYSFLEESFTVIVANPSQIKPAKGKKTDLKDSEHIARLLQVNAIQPSFVPPPEIRELRDLCRQYMNLTEDRTRYKNRVIKTLRQAGITLDTCMTDVFGKSGRKIIEALIAGANIEAAAKGAMGKLVPKIPQIVEAVRYPMTEHKRQVLERYWRLMLNLDAELADLDGTIDQKMAPYKPTIKRFRTLTGVGHKVARGIVSELGDTVIAFPSDKHLCSWVKVCPGNRSSGGKHKNGSNSYGNRYLRAYLGEAAWAAVRTRGSEFRDLYLRRAPRLGKKKAIVSIQHKMLRLIYMMQDRGIEYCKTYAFDHAADRRFAQVRGTIRGISNEDLTRELLARGAKTVLWSWDESDPTVPAELTSV